MRRCLQLAKNGLGTTYPNPMVGSIVVYNDQILGEGWHHQAGAPHAEVNAIHNVFDQELLPKATIYVSLEPCSHYGKTPPCSDLIIAKGIKKVVIGTVDPFAAVAGKGIKKLLDAGCEVQVGILEDACKNLNRRFFTFHQKKRPYIILKWAQTHNGFIAPDKKDRETIEPVWITQSKSKQLVHKWRSEERAILVGTNTVWADNPSLTTRTWNGNSPMRVIIDRNGKLNKNAKVFDNRAHTLIFVDKETKTSIEHVEVVAIDFQKEVPTQIANHLFKIGIQSVIVEGGQVTLQHFIDAGLWDEARVFEGSIQFTNGVKAPVLKNEILVKQLTETSDLLTIYAHTELK